MSGKLHPGMGTISKCAALGLTISVVLASCGGGTAGTGGYELSGKIYDDSGVAILNASITVEQEDGDVISSLRSDDTGSFLIPAVPKEGAILRVARESKTLGTVPVAASSASQGAYIEMREQSESLGCLSSVLTSDSGGLATRRVVISGNINPLPGFGMAYQIDSSAASGNAGEPALSADERLGSSDFSFVLTVRDLMGQDQQLVIGISNRGNYTFHAQAYVSSAAVEGANPGGSQFIAVGKGFSLRFNEAGSRLDPVGLLEDDDVVTLTWKGSSAESSVGINLTSFTAFNSASNIQCISVEQ